MPIRQRVVTYGVSTAAAATITVAALLQPWRSPEPRDLVHETAAAAARRPVDGTALPFGSAASPGRAGLVDVVFAVDTTGSMGGLIEGAKRTVWSIATHIRKTDPNAELRIGLVAYRDIGDDYVTRDFALNSDLDAVFAELSGFRAAGGGDTPEDVDAALDDALHKMQWRADAKKLVFLVGDAPPASRGDVPRFDVLAREAADKQIILNTIRCGLDHDTEIAWQQIATLGHGQFSSVRQDGGVQQIATPYDDKLAEISARIDSTAVIVGSDGDRHAYDRKMGVARSAPKASKADRAAFYAAESAAGDLRDSNDLVGNVANGRMAVEAAPAAALPADLRGLEKPALKEEIGKRVAQRQAAQQELKKVAKQREDFLKDNAKGSDGFDAKVNAAIDAQLK